MDFNSARKADSLNTRSPTVPLTAILSDIHANLPALEAVLREVKECRATRVVFLGDLVGYGASPSECVTLIREHGGECVIGNHDVEISETRKRGCAFRDPDWKRCPYQAGLAHAAWGLDEDQAQWLAALPFKMKLDGAMAAHGSLNDPEAFHYIKDIDSALPTLDILRKERVAAGFFGHTHLQGIFTEVTHALEWLDGSTVRITQGSPCAITIGSVGRPRHETDRRAAWALWDSENRVVEFRKTTYNRLRAAHDIMVAGLPLESALELLTAAEIAALLKQERKY